jgi:hypothetical protein
MPNPIIEGITESVPKIGKIKLKDGHLYLK